MTAAIALVVLLGIVGPADARKRPPMPCADGRFLIAGEALMTGSAAADDMIVIRGTRLAVKSGCGPATIQVQATSAGSELRAKWPGCRAARGTVRLRARFDGSCDLLSGDIVNKRAKRRLSFSARRDTGNSPPSVTTTTSPAGSTTTILGATTTTILGGTTTTTLPYPVPEGTFRDIVDHVFKRRGCAVSTCHGEAASGGLRLDPEHAYGDLVGVAAANPAAGGQLRVDPGHFGTSFLSRKLHGTLTIQQGAPMPLGAAPLPVLERDLIDIWIGGGAPLEGDVEGAPHITGEPYRPADPLPPPPAPGVQLVLDGPMLAPGQETEGCMWVPVPNSQNVLIRGIELSSNPGTHHLAVWRYDRAGVPPNLNQWRAGDIACLQSGASIGSPLGGTSVALFTTASWGRDVATVFPGGTYVGLNGHYYNEFDVPIQVKFWINYLPFEGTPKHVMQGIVSLDTTFGVNVPAFTQQTRRGRYVNNSGKTQHILWAGGHMHKRGLQFSGWFSDRTPMFIDYDWEHPVGRLFDPPYELRNGDWIDYECLHDNGVTRPVRRNGSGDPATVIFGISAEDEMCILVGNYYSD